MRFHKGSSIRFRGRISYEDISFPEIYDYVKSLQSNCLVMDLNGSKYPEEALFYSDIRCYEQGAGQVISADANSLPAMACYPLQRTWFWKEEFPTSELKDVEAIVRDNIIPYNNAYCTYILNAAPNRDGLIDDNAVEVMARIGRLWKNTGHIVDVPEALEQRLLGGHPWHRRNRFRPRSYRPLPSGESRCHKSPFPHLDRTAFHS